MTGQRGEDELVGGRVGRFNRRFEGMGGSKSGSSDIDWMEIGEGVEDGTPDSKPKGGKSCTCVRIRISGITDQLSMLQRSSPCCTNLIAEAGLLHLLRSFVSYLQRNKIMHTYRFHENVALLA